MKQVSLILSAISLAGVAILFFLFLSENRSTSSPVDDNDVEISDDTNEASKNIAVVEVDSLVKYYMKAAQMKEQLANERIKYENELSASQRKLLADAEKFKRTAPTMSNFEAQQRQKALLEREQQIMQTEQQLSQRLAYSEALFLSEINDSLNAFLADYVKNQNFDVILSDNQAGVVLWKRSGVNITQDVVDGMNSRLKPETSPK